MRPVRPVEALFCRCFLLRGRNPLGQVAKRVPNTSSKKTPPKKIDR
jgi:hypothetical protein